MDVRIFIEKKSEYRSEALSLLEELKADFPLEGLRVIDIYDIFDLEEELRDKVGAIIADPAVDDVYYELDLTGKKYLAYEYLPGQYDQEANIARELIRLARPETRAVVQKGKVVIFEGDVDPEKAARYFINPADARRKDLSKLEKRLIQASPPVAYVYDFFEKTPAEIKKEYNLALTEADIAMIRDYFRKENRLPTETELLFFETYWSDHCRHTTFLTELSIEAEDEDVKAAYEEYQKTRRELGRADRPVTLMDITTVNMLYEKARGNLDDLEESEEKNACSIYVDVDVDGRTEKWLLFFKNETHNHPTEIEPFGGAATCIGGAIRDPLSGRGWVYQAIRLTGSGDVRTPIDKTLPGKLPQRLISKQAAAGYSSYGNQIGVAAAHVREVYHPGFVAKRMELGAVIAASPLSALRRKKPEPGDLILLLGGRTGRDGIGGASGSSKAHDEKASLTAAAEVQKGDPLAERKLLRLFRNPAASRMIKRSNDFGAGGVSVAVGELSPGVRINLDAIPVKYEGLSATELALSESQERMAVVIAPEDLERFLELAGSEGVEASVIAEVTGEARLAMTYRGDVVLAIDRAFIDTAGARQKAEARISPVDYDKYPYYRFKGTLKEKILAVLGELNVCDQKGLVEMFDATADALTVVAPYGGARRATPNQGAVAKLPVPDGKTSACSIMTYGYDPYLASFSPFHGARGAVLSAAAKVVAIGGDYRKIRYSFQEYFEKLGSDPLKWGKPAAALLGAFSALKELGLACVGGKDSMSGSFNDLHVPPSLVAFAVAPARLEDIITPELKEKGNLLYYLKPRYNERHLADIGALKEAYERLLGEIAAKNVVSAYAIEAGGLAAALAKTALGNGLGVHVSTAEDIFYHAHGGILLEARRPVNYPDFIYLGTVIDDAIKINEAIIAREEAEAALKTLEGIYPASGPVQAMKQRFAPAITSRPAPAVSRKNVVRVLIPVFPGATGELALARAFRDADAATREFVFKTRSEAAIAESFAGLERAIDEADILALPDGAASAGFIANALVNPKVKAAVQRLIARKGLILGLGAAFSALLRVGLLPGGDYRPAGAALTENAAGRYISRFARTKVTSVASPWLSSLNSGDIFNVVFSSDAGRFVIPEAAAAELFARGQVAFQFCDTEGEAAMDPLDNPSGSYHAVEGIISPDGLILGKTCLSERFGAGFAKNIQGVKRQDIFAGAVAYLKKENGGR